MEGKQIKSANLKTETVVKLEQKVRRLQKQIEGFKNKILKLENKSLKQEQRNLVLEAEIAKLKEPKSGGFIDLSEYQNKS